MHRGQRATLLGATKDTCRRLPHTAFIFALVKYDVVFLIGTRFIMVRTYKRKTTVGNWTQEIMDRALNDVQCNGLSLRAAGKKHKISKDAIRRRLSGKLKRTAHLNKPILGAKKRVLSDQQEAELVKHIIQMENALFGLTPEDIRSLVFRYCELNNISHPFNQDNRLAGRDWVTSFLARQKTLSLRKPEALSLCRAQGMRSSEVQKYFQLLGTIISENNLTAHDIFNMDETGVQNVHRPSKIVALKGKASISAVTSGERGKTVTLVWCVSASGQVLPPVFVFPRKKMKPSLTEHAPSGSMQCVSDNGWITEDIFTQFLEHFVGIVRCRKERKILLILDGHSTHTKNLTAITYACENGIIMLSLPPHCTQKMQPLDVSFFRPFKAAYDKACRQWMHNHAGRRILMDDIAGICKTAFDRCSNIGNIVNGFAATGIWPFDPHIFDSTNEVLPPNENTIDIPLDIPIDQGIIIPCPDTNPISESIIMDIDFDKIIRNCAESSDSTNENIVVQFIDLAPVPQIPEKTKSNRAGTSEILTTSPYKKILQEKKDKKILKISTPDKKLLKKKRKSNLSRKKNEPKNKAGNKMQYEDTSCIVCEDHWTDSKAGEAWMQCRLCKGWLHEKCAGGSSSRGAICQNCK